MSQGATRRKCLGTTALKRDSPFREVVSGRVAMIAGMGPFIKQGCQQSRGPYKDIPTMGLPVVF